MSPRRVDVREARRFWAHPSQHVMGSHPDTLPQGEPFQYWAHGPVCVVFHPTFWPGVWMAHHGCKPEGWGRAVEPARAILAAFQEAERPELIIGWTAKKNRAALAFARRVGFEEDGRLPLGSGDVIMQSWRH